MIAAFNCDCLQWLSAVQDNSIDLIFGSPPYESARDYGIGFNLSGQAWVDWMVERWIQMARVSRGLVAMVVEGRTKDFRWSATPSLLMADLHRAGIALRKPPAFCRVGIPGSGGPDWLRNDYEFIVCSSKGRLPWSDNTAMGHEPKYRVGGKLTNRASNGERNSREFKQPSKANPGNLIRCKAGGGLMGDRKCHENEAPFPEQLAEFFIRSFCQPGGVVLDPFCGSGTTLAVAQRCGRRAIGLDVRQSQCDLTIRRCNATT